MARNLPQPPARPGPGVYWRRRATVLALGIGVISVLAWSVTAFASAPGHAGRPGRSGSRATATDRPQAAATRRAASPPAAASRPPAARPSPARPAHRAASGQGASGQGASPATGNAAAARPPAGVAPACAPRKLVLSVAASRGSYNAGSQPQFEVYVVSLSARDCSVNVGARYLSLVIKAGGTSRVWGSADCSARSGARFVQLSQGVPLALHFTWDRKASAPGCRLSRTQARPGTYAAAALAPALHLASQDRVFVLYAPGTAVP